MGSSVIDLVLPRLGETMDEARVTLWLKAPGEAFRRGEILLEVETDKTAVEVPALYDGTLIAQLVAPGEIVALDQPIAQVETVVDVPAAAPVVPRPDAPSAVSVVSEGTRTVVALPGGRIAASPRARRLARKAGADISGLTGSGRRGWVTGQDVEMSGQQSRSGIEMVPTPFGTIAVNRIAPQTLGEAAKATIVLLHGLFDQGRGWRDIPHRLAQAGHPILVPDLPGHGASLAKAGDTTEMIAAVVAALAQALPHGPLRLVGHSLGAALAVGAALHMEQRVESLVLIAPFGLRAKASTAFLDVMIRAQTPEDLSQAMDMLGGAPLSESALGTEFLRLQQRREDLVPLVHSLASDGVQMDLAASLAGLTLPMVAVFGLQDRIIDWHDCANLPARAAIHLFKTAGHLPHAEAPDLLAELIAAPQGKGFRSNRAERA